MTPTYLTREREREKMGKKKSRRILDIGSDLGRQGAIYSLQQKRSRIRDRSPKQPKSDPSPFCVLFLFCACHENKSGASASSGKDPLWKKETMDGTFLHTRARTVRKSTFNTNSSRVDGLFYSNGSAIYSDVFFGGRGI